MRALAAILTVCLLAAASPAAENAEKGDWRKQVTTELQAIMVTTEKNKAAAGKKRTALRARLDEPKGPIAGQDWENSLGMSFTTVGDLLFSIWETRVQDFEAFVKATDYDATGDVYSLGSDGWKKRGDTWRNPGFSQERRHPVVGVSWEDATAFCEWLTEKERSAGLLAEGQIYRLPTDKEWSEAAGYEQYPWGNDWPPPAGAGNFAGSEVQEEIWPSNWLPIEGYQDGFARTSPTGSFKPNKHGLYDTGGNAWEWCSSWYRKEMNNSELRKKYVVMNEDGGGQKYQVLRGGSWGDYDPEFLHLSYRNGNLPNSRYDYYGFRCVLVPVKSDH